MLFQFFFELWISGHFDLISDLTNCIIYLLVELLVGIELKVDLLYQSLDRLILVHRRLEHTFKAGCVHFLAMDLTEDLQEAFFSHLAHISRGFISGSCLLLLTAAKVE